MPIQYLTSEHVEMLEAMLPKELDYCIEQTTRVRVSTPPEPVAYEIAIFSDNVRFVVNISAEQFAEIRDVPAYMQSVIDRAVAHIYPKEVQDD